MKIVTITQRYGAYKVKVERLKPHRKNGKGMFLDSLETIWAEDLDGAMSKARRFMEEPDGE